MAFDNGNPEDLATYYADMVNVEAVVSELHRTLEALSPREWNALERAVPGELARQLRSLTDAYLATRRARVKRELPR